MPTFAEQGVHDQDADTLTGIVAPAATPKEIVELLSREIAKSVARPDVSASAEALTAPGDDRPVAPQRQAVIGPCCDRPHPG